MKLDRRHTFTVTVGEGHVVTACAGERLVEVMDRANAPVPFSCRGGACGTCAVRVTAGMENLSSRTDNEEIIVPDIARGDDVRLACQVIVYGPVTLVVHDERLESVT